MQGRFIYGFIHTDKPGNLGPIGIDQKEVHVLPYKDMAAVVSELPLSRFDSLPKETLLRNLAVYQAVIEYVMNSHHIVPMKFGTIVREEEVGKILEKGGDQISTKLKETENKVELEMVALWADLGRILEEIGEEEEITRLKVEAASTPPEQTFDAMIRVGVSVKAVLDRKRSECSAEILESLKTEAEDLCLHSVMDDSMIVNAGFLMFKDRTASFEAKVGRLDKHFHDKINFKIVGPLPPYSFSTFEMKKVEYAEVDQAREMLGLKERTTPLEIRERYWELIKKFHPDKFPGAEAAQDRFEKITKAYHVLNDYCREGQCSFRERDVREWMVLKPLGRPEISV